MNTYDIENYTGYYCPAEAEYARMEQQKERWDTAFQSCVIRIMPDADKACATRTMWELMAKEKIVDYGWELSLDDAFAKAKAAAHWYADCVAEGA